MAPSQRDTQKTSLSETTLNQAQVAVFEKDSSDWWDETGPFSPLHRLNPLRIHYIRERIASHFGRDNAQIRIAEGLKILDIGCGGGLVSESLSRLGADMTGIDADANAISVAKAHAQQEGLNINYQAELPEALAQGHAASFDIVLALEVIEHVADPALFMQSCAKLCKPDGMVIMSTLNRTPKSYLLGIIAAEHILGWVPKGTHDWKAFLKPRELHQLARANGLAAIDQKAIVFDMLSNSFSVREQNDPVNYIVAFKNLAGAA